MKMQVLEARGPHSASESRLVSRPGLATPWLPD